MNKMSDDNDKNNNTYTYIEHLLFSRHYTFIGSFVLPCIKFNGMLLGVEWGEGKIAWLSRFGEH